MALLMTCSRQVQYSLATLLTFDPDLCIGPISESDFFTWEALIQGPKDTPFVSDLI